MCCYPLFIVRRIEPVNVGAQVHGHVAVKTADLRSTYRARDVAHLPPKHEGLLLEYLMEKSVSEYHCSEDFQSYIWIGRVSSLMDPAFHKWISEVLEMMLMVLMVHSSAHCARLSPCRSHTLYVHHPAHLVSLALCVVLPLLHNHGLEVFALLQLLLNVLDDGGQVRNVLFRLGPLLLGQKLVGYGQL
jgi:hypothetical protein